MSCFFGIDTSNYTTSLAIYDTEKGVRQIKRLLPVAKGEHGLRQSDALFHHTKALPELADVFFDVKPEAVGVSSKPRDAAGSYMPCFLAGVSAAHVAADAAGVRCFEFSHQAGHIAAAVYSSGHDELIGKEFLAFHISGGTTDFLHITPDDGRIFRAETIGTSLDLTAGQAVDRVGMMLRHDFPAGKRIEEDALKSNAKFKIKTCVNGTSCNMSGLENQCRKMIDNGESPEDTALYCIDFIELTLEKMLLNSYSAYKELPVVFAGGVMSNSIIREYFTEKYNAFFAEPEFSCDNAAGIAYLTYLMREVK